MINLEHIIKNHYPEIFEKYPLFVTKFFLYILKKLFKEKEINSFLNTHEQDDTKDFVDNVLKYFDFSYYCKFKENIPKKGRVVFVANHPLGSLDALCLISLIYSVRKDIKILANELLYELKPLREVLFPVDNLGQKSSSNTAKKVISALNNEEAIIIFPAGEVSRLKGLTPKDGVWKSGFLHFCKITSSPIVPILIEAKNSSLFYAISTINKPLSSLMLVREMFIKKGGSLTIKVGETIPYKNIESDKINLKNSAKLVKKHLYRIGTNKPKIFETQQNIPDEQNVTDIKKELQSAIILGKTGDGKIIYLTSLQKDSILLKELGRLREITFRKVGEGTGKSYDVDEYDLYYKHIILWDENENLIVGAYRIGESDNIKKIKKSYYCESLFKFSNDAKFLFTDTIELGRSFVRPKYWGTYALDYLWFGIGAYISKYKNIKYMFGPVSISNNYSKDAKDMLVYFYSRYFAASKNIVISKNRYMLSQNKIKHLDTIFNANDYKENFKILKQNLATLGFSIPTLYKQYSELCENGGVKFLDFGVDPDFNNSLDGFLVVEISKIKDTKRQKYIDNFLT